MSETQRQPVPRDTGGELETAVAFLDFARACVVKKTEGLPEEDLARPVVPTGTSLRWLVSHLTDSERFWFVAQTAGRGDEPDWSAASRDDRPWPEVLEDYRAAVAESNEVIRGVGDPEALSARTLDGRRHTLRWTLAHMTSETARHAGHADLARELIDGVTGR